MAELRHKRSFGSWIKRMSISSSRSFPGKSSSKKPVRVYGVPLIESVCYARSTVGYVDEEAVKHRRAGIIPLVVAKCGSFLKAHALHTEGIFRKSGGMKRVAALQIIFDDPHQSHGLHLNWLGYSVHDAATVLCRYLQRLPEPVIPHVFYEPFCNVMSDKYYQKTKDRIQAFQDLVKRLPIPHQHLLLYLLDLLSLFESHEDENRMSASNLAVVFGPSILRHPRHNDPIQHRIAQRVLEFLIEFQALFTMKILNHKHSNNIPVLPNHPQPLPPPLLPPLEQQQQQQQQQSSTVIPSVPTWPVRPPSSPPGTVSSGRTPRPHHSLHPHPSVTPSTTPVCIHNEPYVVRHQTPGPPPQHPQDDDPSPLVHLLQFCLAQPYGFWPSMAAFCGILGTCVYEAYEAFQCRRWEPYVFFVGFSVYWTLLIQGIEWSKGMEREEEEEEEEEEEDMPLSLFDDAFQEIKDDDETMFRNVGDEWHSLFSRSWRDQNTTIQPDQMSITSAASRFDEEGAGRSSGEEEEEYNDGDDDDDDDDDGANDFSYAIPSVVELSAMWKRQQSTGMTSEKWKIRRYPQTQ